MNKMKEVAQLLGVELNEEFEVVRRDYRCKITNEGLMKFSIAKGEWDKTIFSTMDLLLLGKFEVRKPILDKQEKEYLENVIRPFKDRVKHIIKRRDIYMADMEYITIDVKGEYGIYFPYFEKGKMYKGMQAEKPYTLKELGLFENE